MSKVDRGAPAEAYDNPGIGDEIDMFAGPPRKAREAEVASEEDRKVVQEVQEEATAPESAIAEALDAEEQGTPAGTVPVAPAVQEEASAEGEEEEEDEQSELDLLREQNRKLLDMLNKGVFPLPATQQETPEAQPPQPTLTAAEIAARQQQQQQFHSPVGELTDAEFEEITGDPKRFDQYLRDREAMIMQSVLSNVTAVVNRTLNTRAEIAGFFAAEDNADLGPLKDQVSRIAAMVQSNNPGMSNRDALKQAADHVRETLSLRTVKNGTKARSTQPRFARPTNSRKASPREAQPRLKPSEMNSIADELDAMANLER